MVKEVLKKLETINAERSNGMYSYPRAKRWVFTIPAKEGERLPVWEGMVGRVYQIEKAPSTGYIHIQGAVVFKDRTYLKPLKRLHEKAHWEIMKGKVKQAFDYCRKDDTRVEGPFEEGDIESAEKKHDLGARNDRLEVIETILNEGLATAVIKHTKHLVKNFGNYVKCAELLTKDYVRNKPRNIILWGIGGSGKTEWAKRHFYDYYVLSANQNGGNVWFPGYNEHKTLIINEFGKGGLPINLMKQFTDRVLDFHIETKGGNIRPKWDTVIMISNDPPNEWYPNCSDADRNAFFSRITAFINADEVYKDTWRSTDKVLHLKLAQGKLKNDDGTRINGIDLGQLVDSIDEIRYEEKTERWEKHESVPQTVGQSLGQCSLGNTRNIGLKNVSNQNFTTLSLDKPDKDAEDIASEESDGFV